MQVQGGDEHLTCSIAETDVGSDIRMTSKTKRQTNVTNGIFPFNLFMLSS
jgi:hypothetical protein